MYIFNFQRSNGVMSYSLDQVEQAATAAKSEVLNEFSSCAQIIEKEHHLLYFPERAAALNALDDTSCLDKFQRSIVDLFFDQYVKSHSIPMVRRFLDLQISLDTEVVPKFIFQKIIPDPAVKFSLSSHGIEISENSLVMTMHAVVTDVIDKCQIAVMKFFEKQDTSFYRSLYLLENVEKDDAGILLISGFAARAVIKKLGVDDEKSDLLSIAKRICVPTEEKSTFFERFSAEERSFLQERDRGLLTFVEPEFLDYFHKLNNTVSRELVFEAYEVYGQAIIQNARDVISEVRSRLSVDFSESMFAVSRRKAFPEPAPSLSLELCELLTDKFVNVKIGESFVVVREAFASGRGRRTRGGQGLRDALFALNEQM